MCFKMHISRSIKCKILSSLDLQYCFTSIVTDRHAMKLLRLMWFSSVDWTSLNIPMRKYYWDFPNIKISTKYKRKEQITRLKSNHKKLLSMIYKLQNIVQCCVTRKDLKKRKQNKTRICIKKHSKLRFTCKSRTNQEWFKVLV